MVDMKSFAIGEDQEDVGIGQNIGAVLNTKKNGFGGIAMLNSDFGQLPLEDFKNLLRNIVIK